jgi:hypothetical protein
MLLNLDGAHQLGLQSSISRRIRVSQIGATLAVAGGCRAVNLFHI